MAQIVPKSKAPGVDFCGVDENYYIVRSDLGTYMRSTNFKEGAALHVFSLHQSCRGGDHYLAHDSDLFYIIKGDNYRRVSNLSNDQDAVVYSLHPNCRGGDHYFSAFGNFYIIFLKKRIYRRVDDMHQDENAIEFPLHPECQNGLYYWGTKNYCYFVKPRDEWGVQYLCCTSFHKFLEPMTYSFHGSVLPFIPGGLAVNQGVAFGKWEAIKTITNNSDTPIIWSKKITKKVGYNKTKMSSLEHNWSVSLCTTYESGALTEALSKYQFSLSAEYGGTSINTQQEDWSEATEVEESINVTLQPQTQMYIWQYQVGLGKEPVLFCRDMMFTTDSTPSDTVPLPPANM